MGVIRLDGKQAFLESTEGVWEFESSTNHAKEFLDDSESGPYRFGPEMGDEIYGNGDSNGTGSHDELWKLQRNTPRFDLMVRSIHKYGGIYLYANQHGCDGNGLYWERFGCMICVDGKVWAVPPQIELRDVVVISATIDIDDVRSYRAVSTNAVVVFWQPSNNTDTNQNSNYE